MLTDVRWKADGYSVNTDQRKNQSVNQSINQSINHRSTKWTNIRRTGPSCNNVGSALLMPSGGIYLFSPLGKLALKGYYILLALISSSLFFSLGAKLSQYLLDRFSRSFYQMEGICVNFLDPVQFFRFLKGSCHGNQFCVVPDLLTRSRSISGSALTALIGALKLIKTQYKRQKTNQTYTNTTKT